MSKIHLCHSQLLQFTEAAKLRTVIASNRFEYSAEPVTVLNPKIFKCLKHGFCRNHMFKLRYPDGFICPRCGCRHYYPISGHKQIQCHGCRYQVSVTVATVMDKSHISLVKWFWAIFLVSKDKRGCSASMISRELELPYNTAWFLLQRIRKAMSARDNIYQLFGFVDMDEAYFGATCVGNKRGRGTKKAKVIIALSLNSKCYPEFVKMRVVTNIKGKTIDKFAEDNISGGSHIRTDGISYYRKPLKKEYFHEYKIFDPNDLDGHLKWLLTIISNVKAFISGTYHGLGSKHLQRYLDEFSYRFNRRYFHGQLFNRLLCAVATASPLRLAELT